MDWTHNRGEDYVIVRSALEWKPQEKRHSGKSKKWIDRCSRRRSKEYGSR